MNYLNKLKIQMLKEGYDPIYYGYGNYIKPKSYDNNSENNINKLNTNNTELISKYKDEMYNNYEKMNKAMNTINYNMSNQVKKPTNNIPKPTGYISNNPYNTEPKPEMLKLKTPIKTINDYEKTNQKNTNLDTPIVKQLAQSGTQFSREMIKTQENFKK